MNESLSHELAPIWSTLQVGLPKHSHKFIINVLICTQSVLTLSVPQLFIFIRSLYKTKPHNTLNNWHLNCFHCQEIRWRIPLDNINFSQSLHFKILPPSATSCNSLFTVLRRHKRRKTKFDISCVQEKELPALDFSTATLSAPILINV